LKFGVENQTRKLANKAFKFKLIHAKENLSAHWSYKNDYFFAAHGWNINMNRNSRYKGTSPA